MNLRFCHLYGNLLNTHGDNGNLLMLQYVARQLGHEVETTLISIHDQFDADAYDFIFIGGGQDHEQKVVAEDLVSKQDALREYIENGGCGLAIGGGYQLLGQYYEAADGQQVNCAGVLPHYTKRQLNQCYADRVEVHSDLFNESYVGMENHYGCTFLGESEQPLGKITTGFGNNGQDQTEGAIYKNIICSYFHGPLLVHNRHLAKRLVDMIVQNKK